MASTCLLHRRSEPAARTSWLGGTGVDPASRRAHRTCPCPRALGTVRLTVACAALLALAACTETPSETGGASAAVSPRTLLGSAPGLRPLLGQLTGSGYAPCHSVENDLLPAATCSPAPSRDPALAETLRSRRIGRTSDRQGEDEATNLHLRGLWELLWGVPARDGASAGENCREFDPSFLNRAVRALERAAALDPGAAPVWSDLAAALVARAQVEENPLDLLSAVEATSRALALDPCLRAARFNRGLALASLGAISAAEEAFDGYSAPSGCPPSSPDPGWAREAAEQRDGLQRPRSLSFSPADERALRDAALAGDRPVVEDLVERFGGEVTRLVENELFGEWGRLASTDASDRGTSGTSPDLERADRMLGAIELIGEVLESRLDDRMPADSARVVRRTKGTGAYEALARAHRVIASVPEGCNRENVARSISELVSARRVLERSGSPFAAWGHVAEAVCRYYAEEYRRSLGALIAAQESGALGTNGRLGARSARLQGLLHYHLGEYPAALASYRRAAGLAAGIGEVHEEARALSGIAETAEQLGLYRDAWLGHLQALRLAPRIADGGTIYIAFSGAASLARRTGRPDLAAPLRRQATEEGSRSRSTGVRVQAAIQHARLEAEMDQPEAALERLRGAMEEAAGSGSAALVADLDRAVAEVLAESDPVQALSAYDRTIAADEETGYTPALPRALLARARLRSASGDVTGAALDLDQAEHVVAAQRALLAELNLEERASFAATVRDLADERVSLEAVGRGRAEAAYFEAERATAAALADWLDGGVAGNSPPADLDTSFLQPLPAAEVERRLPAGTSLAMFRVLPERTLVWCFDDQGFRAAPPIEARRNELERHVATWVELLRTASVESQRERDEAGELAELLLRPCGYFGPAVERLVLVPDGPLHGLPFAALIGPDGGRLVKTMEIVVTPSVASHLASERRFRSLPVDQPPFVTVFAHEGATRDLPRLAWVEAETERVVSAYGRAARTRVFVGSEATVARFREWVAKTEILHVAAHAFGDELAPSRARLELAAVAEASGRIEVAEVLRLRPARTRIVMLSACSTADPAAAARGGASTLALAFLAAGVPSVIASLWRVDDSEWTADLAGKIHAGLAEGLRTSESLARAQRQLITAGAPPRVWAVFQVYGAGVAPSPITPPPPRRPPPLPPAG